MKVKIYNCFETEFYAKMVQFQKKAEKVGKELTFFETDCGKQKIKDREIYLEYRIFEVDCAGLNFEGWHVHAKKEVIDGVNVVIPYDNVPHDWKVEEQFSGKIKCQHCGHNRKRHSSFILEHEEGFKVEVGSTCVNEFVGNLNALKITHVIQNLMSYLLELEVLGEDYESKIESKILSSDEYLGGSGYGNYMFNTRHLIAVAARVHEKQGFVKSDSVGSNKKEMLDIIFDDPAFYAKMITDKYLAMADEIISFYKDEEYQNNSEFEQNMRAFATQEYLTAKSFGFVAYMPEHFKKSKEEKIQKESVVSEYFGAIKTRFKNVACVVSNKKIIYDEYSPYNSSFELLTFTVLDGGNQIVWWNSGSRTGLEVGEVGLLSGTPKKHQVSKYSGLKETLISRGSFIKLEE